MNDYYVYQLRVEDEDLPFYVGKGKGVRAYLHTRRTRRVTFKSRKIEKANSEGKSVLVEFLEKSLREDEAFQYEAYFISAYGRRDLGLGPLTNITDGGDGVSGYRHSDEFKVKRSASMTNRMRTLPKEERDRLYGQRGESHHNFGKHQSEITKSKIGQSKAGKIFVTDGVTSKLIVKDELDAYISKGWRRGQTK